MAKPDKSSSNSSNAKGPGRFTPKGSAVQKATAKGPVRDGAASEKRPQYETSGRYTAPSVHEETAQALQVTRPWVPWVMFALFAIGGLMIVLNYVDILPSSPSNWYILGGIAAITGGFITATQLR